MKKGISVEPVSLLIGTALALFRKGRAKGGTWHDLEYVPCLLRQQVACITKKPAAEKDLYMFYNTSGGRCDRGKLQRKIQFRRPGGAASAKRFLYIGIFDNPQRV